MTDRVLWSPGVAAVLSLVIPGAGQMYKGQVLNGLVWLVVVVIGYVMFIGPGVILHIFCILGAASGKNTAPDPAAPNPDTPCEMPRLPRTGIKGCAQVQALRFGSATATTHGFNEFKQPA